MQRTLSALDIKHTEKQLKDAFYDVKNSIKHVNSRKNMIVNIDSRKESIDYILSAYRNFEKLGLQDNLSITVKKVIDSNTIYIEVDT